MSDELEGRTALITGSSAGLGIDFADRLAARGADVVLVARREQKLQQVAADLKADHGIETDWISMDLATLDSGDELYEEVVDRGFEIDILVNNAGFGVYGDFLEIDWETQETMMTLDMITPVRLAHLFGRDMVDRGWGRMIQVASIGAYQPSPTYATYSATKSFLRSWGEAFDFELRNSHDDVTSTVVCPGVTETEFFDSAGQDTRTWYQKLTIMDSPTVAEIGVKAMLKKRITIVPGFINAFNTWLTRFIPRFLLRWVAYVTMMGGKQDEGDEEVDETAEESSDAEDEDDEDVGDVEDVEDNEEADEDEEKAAV